MVESYEQTAANHDEVCQGGHGVRLPLVETANARFHIFATRNPPLSPVYQAAGGRRQPLFCRRQLFWPQPFSRGATVVFRKNTSLDRCLRLIDPRFSHFPPLQEPEVPEQAVTAPASMMGTPAQSGAAGGGGAPAADLSGFGDTEDFLRSSGAGAGGRRNVFAGGSGYDMY